MGELLILVIAAAGFPAGVVLGYLLRHIDVFKMHSPPDPLKKALRNAQAAFKRQMEEKMLQQLGLAGPTAAPANVPVAAAAAVTGPQPAPPAGSPG